MKLSVTIAGQSHKVDWFVGLLGFGQVAKYQFAIPIPNSAWMPSGTLTTIAKGLAKQEYVHAVVAQILGKRFDLSVESRTSSQEFSGLVTEIHVGEDITVIAEGFGSQLQGHPRSRVFEAKTTDSILSAICDSTDGVEVEKTGSSISPEVLSQRNESDWDFLLRVADVSGYFVLDGPSSCRVTTRTFDRTATLGAAQLETAGRMIVSARNSDVRFASTTGNRAKDLQTKTVSGDWKKGLPALSTAAISSGAVCSETSLTEFAGLLCKQSELNDFARQRSLQLASETVRFEATTTNLSLVPGSGVVFDETGPTQDPLVVQSCSFQASTEGATCTFSAIPKAALVPFRVKPQTQDSPRDAVVTDDVDPENLHRVRIKYVDEYESGELWARVVYQGQGTVKVPRIGDRVFVDFEHGNPDRPVVLGTMYSGAQPPKTATEGGSQEVTLVQAANGATIRVIEQPDRGSIEISLPAKSGRSTIKLGVDGKGRITIETTGELSLAGKSVSISGDEVSINGKTIRLGGEDLQFIASKNSSLIAEEAVNVTGQKSVKIEGKKIELN